MPSQSKPSTKSADTHTPNDFNDRIEALFRQLEDAIDASDLDADYENQGSVFTVTVEGCAPLILNRHGPTQQLWLAARSGGYHTEYSVERGAWLCTRSGENLRDLWNAACKEQFGVVIALQ